MGDFWAGAGGGLIGGALGGIGSALTTRAAQNEARANRHWQQYMSSTAYQRAMVDLKQAGLNPLIALGKPASTPGGNVAPVQNILGNAVNSASSAMRTVTAGQLASALSENATAQGEKFKFQGALYRELNNALGPVLERLEPGVEAAEKLISIIDATGAWYEGDSTSAEWLRYIMGDDKPELTDPGQLRRTK